MTTRTLCVAVGLSALLAGAANAEEGPAADLVNLVKNSDLIAIGQVLRVTEGELNPELLKHGAKVRTDIAVLVIAEVLRGDPDLKAGKVNIGFPGFPKPDQPTLKVGQHGIWLLTRSDLGHYEVKTKNRFLPVEELAAVRRAIRAASGLMDAPSEVEDRDARISELCKELAGKGPAGNRRLAAYRLGEMGELSTVPVLIAALGDEAPTVRQAAEIALRKITGHRTQVDFQDDTESARQRGIDGWREWFEANKGKGRMDILAAAAQASFRPQPEFLYAIEGLAHYDDLNLLPLFRHALDSALSQKNSLLAAATARYLGRVKDRSAVPKLAVLLGDTETWPALSARTAAAAAIGNIVGRDFGSTATSVRDCIEWWNTNKDSFKGTPEH